MPLARHYAQFSLASPSFVGQMWGSPRPLHRANVAPGFLDHHGSSRGEALHVRWCCGRPAGAHRPAPRTSSPPSRQSSPPAQSRTEAPRGREHHLPGCRDSQPRHTEARKDDRLRANPRCQPKAVRDNGRRSRATSRPASGNGTPRRVRPPGPDPPSTATTGDTLQSAGHGLRSATASRTGGPSPAGPARSGW